MERLRAKPKFRTAFLPLLRGLAGGTGAGLVGQSARSAAGPAPWPGPAPRSGVRVQPNLPPHTPGIAKRSREDADQAMPIAVEMGTPQGPNPGSMRIGDQGARPRGNAALQEAQRRPVFGSVARLCSGFPSHSRGGKIEAQSGERACHLSHSVPAKTDGEDGKEEEGVGAATTLPGLPVP